MKLTLDELALISGLITNEKFKHFENQEKFNELDKITVKIGIEIRKTIEEEKKLNDRP